MAPAMNASAPIGELLPLVLGIALFGVVGNVIFGVLVAVFS